MLPPSMAPPSARRSEFWLTSNRFLARLYASPLVTIAAIRGEGAGWLHLTLLQQCMHAADGRVLLIVQHFLAAKLFSEPTVCPRLRL